MKVDRDLQLKLLQQLQTAYPGRLFSGPLADGLEVDHHHLCCNIAYLSEHGQALITTQIEQSQLDESAKAQLIQSVKSLPAKGLEATVSALAQAGLARLPDAMQLLQRLVSGAI